MYKIYCDNNLIYKSNTSNDGNSELSYSIISGRLQQSLNQSGSLRFTVGKNCVWDTNSYVPMKSIFELYQDDDLIFRGRAFAPKEDLYKRVTIDCEGDFAFFNDTYQEPFEFFGTVRDFLGQIIAFHNSQVEESKQFILGRVTVIPETETGKIVRSSDSYMNTMQMLHNKLFNTELGGYMWVRHEQDGTYLDYLADMGDVNEQAVVQSINLMSAEKELTAESFATVIVPIGAMIEPEEGQEEEIPEYVTIKSVNGGKMYIEDTEAVRRYGRIVKLVEHDGITEPLNLLREATKDLEKATSMTVTTVLTAVDLSSAGYEISPFSFGKYVDVSVKNLGVVDRFLISEITLDLLAPENNTIRIGQKRKTITESGLSQEEIANLTTIKLNKSIIKSNQIDALVHSVVEDLNTFTETVTAEIENLQDQIDGQITTWYYAYAPTLNNEPARSWTTDEEKNNHIGDLFYDSSTGYAYRFMLDGSTYKWVRIADEDISEALALAQKAQDTADRKRRVFTAQPVPPYDKGDLWTQGTTGDILTCMTPKATGEAYSANDWKKLNKYTDDSSLTTFISGTYASDKTNLQGQIDKKAETWYQSTDPSTAWTTAALKAEHKGDLWFNTTDNTTWYYNGSNWVQETIPTEVFNKINGKAQIFTSEPVDKAYNVGDLWLDSVESDIKVAMASRAAGAYNASDWVKRDKYASARDGLENILRNTYNPEKKSGGWDAGTWEVASGGNGVGTIETVSDSPTTYTDKAFRITDNASGNRDWRQYAMPLDNQRKYSFSAWCRGIGGEVTSQVRLWANQQSTAIATNTKVIGTNWTYIEYEYDDITAWNTGDIQVQFGLAGAGSIEYIDPRFIDRTALKEATDRIQVGGRNLAQKALWGRYAGGTVYSGEWENTTVDGYTITATAAPHDIIGAVCPNVTEDKVTVSFETNATSNVKTYWVFNNPICTLTNVTKYDDIKRIVFYHKFNYDKDDVVKYGALAYIAGELTEEMTVGNTKLIDFEIKAASGSFRAGDNGYGIYLRLYIQTADTIIYGAQYHIKYSNITLQKNMLLTPKDGKVSFTLDVPYGATLLNLGVGQYPFASEYYIKNLMVESSTKASNWSPAPEDIDKAIDDITVGGTNLLKGTRTLYTNGSTYGTWKYGAFYKSGTGIIDRVTLTDSPVAGITKGIRLEKTTEDTQIGFTQGAVPVRSGQAVFSVWLKGAVGTKVLLQPYYRNSTEYARKEITLESAEWTRYEVPFEFITAGNWSCGYVYIMGSQPIGTELYVCAPKIEYGNKATDWSESPYDAHKAEGGRNLLKKSNVAIAPTTAYALGNYYFGDEKPIEDEVYTIQIKGSLGANRTNWLLPYNSGGSVSGTILNSYTHTTEYQANNNKLFPVDSYDEATGIYTAHIVWKVGTAANTYLRIYQQPNNTELDPSSIEWIKMEKGYVATDWEPAPEDVAADINVALTAANGKNKVFHQAAAPTTASGLTNGDTWFDTDDGYKMYTWNGTSWVAEQFGTNAIANLAITNAKIANATIESAKIKSLDAGKITTGILNGITIQAGGTNNADGVIEVFDGDEGRVGHWDKDGLLLGNIASALTNPNTKIGIDGRIESYSEGLGTGVIWGGVISSVHSSRSASLAGGILSANSDGGETQISSGYGIFSDFTTNYAVSIDPWDTRKIKVAELGVEGDTWEYTDFLIKEDTVNAPVTEFAKDPLWTDPSSNYLASMLKELLASSRFVAGETFNFGEGPYAGHVTNASKDLHVFIPFNKNGHGLTVVAANVTMPTAFIVRTAQGNYLNGTNADGIASSLLNLTGLSYRANGIHLVYRLKTGAAFSNSLNNSPVSVMITGSMSITFTKP